MVKTLHENDLEIENIDEANLFEEFDKEITIIQNNTLEAPKDVIDYVLKQLQSNTILY